MAQDKKFFCIYEEAKASKGDLVIYLSSTQDGCNFQPVANYKIKVCGYDNRKVVSRSIPLENDGSVLLSHLQSRFRNATGLAVGKSLSDLKNFFSQKDRLYPPLLMSFGNKDNLLNLVSWANSQTLLCTYGTNSSDKFTTPFPPARHSFTPTPGVECLGSFHGSASLSPSNPPTIRSGL